MLNVLSDKHFLRPDDAFGEFVDFFKGVVHCKTCADGAGDAKMLHYRFGAVLARADGDAEFVENHTYVVIVCAVDVER